MAFPTTITGLVSPVSQPFISSGGNVYVIGTDSTTTSKIRAFKATDPTSSFSNVGTDISVTGGNTIEGLAVYQTGDNLHVVTCGSSTIGDVDLYFHIFSMSSDSWTTSNEVIKDTYAIAASAIPREVGISIRSDGDTIVIYNGPKVANMGTDRGRVYYARRESGSWTVDVALDNGGATDWQSGGVVIGSSDRMHFFFYDQDAGDMYQRALTSANSLETFPASFDTAITASNGAQTYLGTSYDASGTQKVRYPYIPSSLTEMKSAKLDSADAPTVSADSDITGASGVGGGNYDSSFSANGTTLWHTFVDNVSDIYTQSNANDGGWSTPESFLTATVTYVKTNIYTRGSDVVLAMAYNDGGIKYHEKTLSTGGSTFSMSAAASATFTGASIAAVPFSQAAAASVTWTGVGLYPAAWSAAAVASVTWTGTAVAGATSADWSSAAAASLTWQGTGLYPAALSSTAAASLTWNGASTAAVSWNSVSSATLTWNGASTAASDLSAAAVASLTWNGTGLYPAAWSSAATASLTWTGATVGEGSWSSSAAGTLTWNGISTAASSLSAAAVATVTWNGISTAASDWNSIASAALTWNGSSSAAADWSSAGVALLTWNGAAVTVAQADLSITATAALTWNGISTASANLSSSAVASVTWNGISTAASDWNSIAAAAVTWNSTAAVTEPADFSITAAGTLTWNGASTSASAWSSVVAASLTWGGTGGYPAAWSSAAVAALAATGAATASGAFTSSALANLVWTSSSTASADWLGSAVGNLSMTGQSTVAGNIVSAAVASVTFTGEEIGGTGNMTITAVAALTWGGEEVGGAVAQRFDGWKPKPDYSQEDMDDLMALFNKAMRQVYGYH